MSNNNRVETFLGWLLLILFYCIIGIAIAGVLDVAGEIEDTNAHIATVMILWPLFVIKYIGLGIILIFDTGLTLLMS